MCARARASVRAAHRQLQQHWCLFVQLLDSVRRLCEGDDGPLGGGDDGGDRARELVEGVGPGIGRIEREREERTEGVRLRIWRRGTATKVGVGWGRC
eukprot:2139002-Pleurochrysis_carterae.AAC.1